MKTLILMRHGKAIKTAPDGLDFNRTLDERGKTEAALMAKVLLQKHYKPEFMVASPAKRTRKTAEIVAKEFGIENSSLDFDSAIYECGIYDLLHVIRELPDQHNCCMIVGHNPAITGMCGLLTTKFLEHVATAGVVVLSFPFETWKMIQPHAGKLIFEQGPPK